MSTLEVRDLSINYVTDDGTALKAVEGLSFSLEQGRSLGLVGESGCGKTTVMLSLMRLLPEAGRIVNGKVLFNGRDLLGVSEREMQAVRWRDISMVFQGAMNALNPVRTVESQIVEAIQHPGLDFTTRQARNRAGELLELVGIPAKRGRQYPHQFSGGMKQRAMIAMALACNPQVLIADEPTTALDVMIQAQILELLDALRHQLGLSVILVTHDLGVVAEVCDSVLVMYGGVTAEYADVDTTFNKPEHPYTQQLLQAFPDLSNPKSKLVAIPGYPPRLNDLPPGCRFEPRCQHAFDRCSQEQPVLHQLGSFHEVSCHLVEDR
jgi:peptide/nickel transport system ATP-binding protein